MVNPAPGTGETRRVYLKTWEVFINGIDPTPSPSDDHCVDPPLLDPGDPNGGRHPFNSDKHCDPPPRKGERKDQAYTHVDVGSGGSAEVTLPTKIFREDPVNITGREYWVEVQQDVAYSVDGSATATVSSGQGYTVSSTAGTATVAVADDDVPEISIASNGDITEGDNATFILTANPAPHAPLSVSVSVSQSSDFGVATGSQTVTIPTTGSNTLAVATTNDAVDEADGSVTATVSDGQGYTVSATASTATVAVADNDDPPPPDATPSLSVSDGSAREDAGVMEFTVSLSAASAKKVLLDAATTSFLHRTATSGDDFEWTIFRLTFAPGETSKVVQVVIIDDDLSEGDESFGLYLAYSHTGTPFAREHGEGVIVDDD